MTPKQLYARAYYLANRSKIMAQSAAYVAEHRDELNAKKRARHASESPRFRWEHRIWIKYRLTPEDYARKLHAQGCCCAACGEPLAEADQVDTDHDHETGKVRDILCSPCNRTLGHARECSRRLRLLADYIDRH